MLPACASRKPTTITSPSPAPFTAAPEVTNEPGSDIQASETSSETENPGDDLLTEITGVFASETEQPANARVTGNNVNLREEPSTESQIMAVLSKGLEIVLLGEENGWANVRVNGVTGYVSDKFVTSLIDTPVDNSAETPEPGDTGEQTPAPGDISTAWISAPDVNLRSLPSKDAEIVGILAYGQEITVLGASDEWVHAISGDIEGYVFKDFVSTDEIAPTAEPVTASVKHEGGGLMVAIDAGHQAHANNSLEPIGPGASESKAKVASGTQGVSTKVPEYQLALAVSLKLRDELLARGYSVYMIRETNDVDISNKERAILAADAGADILVRIHADGSENSAVNGILTLCPTKNNPFIPQLYASSRTLSEDILNAMVAETGAKNRGISEVDNMSGINWSSVPVTIVEMGLMTNPAEDELMETDAYQQKLIKGMADGIDRYFTGQ